MTQDPQFTVQLLEKIGGPLVAAINNLLPEGENTEIEAAKIMAQLLGQTTQVSTALYNMLEIKEDDKQADSTRLALAAMVSPLIAESYSHRKQLPTEDSINRIIKSLEALVSFGENFSPAADRQSRLQTIGQDVVLFDKEQASLIMLQAMVPVINAVEEFSFGQGKVKLLQDIVARLEGSSAQISQKIGEGDKLKELIVFKTLAAFYASCHLAETQRASSANDIELSLDSVWEAFESKVAMIEALMGNDAGGQETVSDSKTPKSAQESTPAESVEKEQPKNEAAPAAGAGGPMGFFKKDPEGGNVAPASEPVIDKVEQPKPSEEKKVDDNASPMGFFKPGAKKEDT